MKKILKEKIKYFFRLPSREFVIKKIKKNLIILVIAAAVSSMLIINIQPSLPLGLYIKYFDKNYRKGNIVIIDIDKKYHKFFNKKKAVKYIMKKIVANENDHIEIRGNHIFVNNDDFGKIEDLSLPIPDLKIREDCYFVLSKKPGTFDSRYFGQVCKKDIKYKAIPFIVF
jgi:peptidase S26, conserved region